MSTFYVASTADELLTKELNVTIDGTKISNAEQLYDAFLSQLSLPEYFGKNLDALFDCLIDLEEFDAKEVIINIKNYDELLSKSTPHFKKEFLIVLADVIDEWHSNSDQQKTMKVGFVNTDTLLDDLSELGIEYAVKNF
jgi:RNAse (barnase) inhibitor barstar